MNLTVGYTRTSNSPLRSEFAACEPWRYQFRNLNSGVTFASE